MITPTRATTVEELILADEQRCEQARWIALCESGPLPENEVEFRRWRKRANKRFRKALKRVN